MKKIKIIKKRINYKMILALILIAYGYTQVYEGNWEDKGNENNYFYVNETYGMDIYEDVCKKVTNQVFREYVKKRIECEGEWCIEEEFKCKKGEKVIKECYEVEHIIDRKGEEYTGKECNKDIAGNLVMAYGKWNMELGTIARKDYNSSEKEKGEVYGKERMRKVREIIERCNPECKKDEKEYKHTKEYEENWDKTKNENNYFYINETYGMDIYENPCEEIKYNEKYRKYIKKIIGCEGEWCIEGEFKCKKDGKRTRECYEAEHIIDKNGPEYKGCNKNIAGNMVMANGKWNGQLGNVARNDYESSKKEKEEVYGEERMKRAREIIERCNPECETSVKEEENESKNGIIIGSVIGVMVISGCGIYVIKKYKKKEEKYERMESIEIERINT